jgi:hypothetical protein
MTEHTEWVTLSVQELKDFFWATFNEGISQGHPCARGRSVRDVFRDALWDAELGEERVNEIVEVVFPKKG